MKILAKKETRHEATNKPPPPQKKKNCGSTNGLNQVKENDLLRLMR